MGINLLRIPFTREKESYSNIKIFPSPFYIPSKNPLVISGLKRSSSLLVTTITGRVIISKKHSDLGIHGDQILWDGKDKRGDYVASGVYLLSIYNNKGESTIEKITVIRY